MIAKHLLSLLCLAPACCIAQDMTLVSGDMIVGTGTRVALAGPIVWTIAPGASVVNDGLIAFGEEAVLVEPIGGPITGTGVESAQRHLPGAFNDVEPGGLGLVLGSNSGVDTLVVTRGHVPFATPAGDQSIARWYQVDAAGSQGTALDMELRYDASELNGLLAPDLVLHKTLDTTSNWLAMASFPGPTSLSAEDQWPWGFLTAFDQDAITSVEAPIAGTHAFSVFPTLVSDHVTIAALGDEPIQHIELMDTRGRSIVLGNSTMVGDRYLDLSSQASGAFLLRVNGWYVTRLVKP